MEFNSSRWRCVSNPGGSGSDVTLMAHHGEDTVGCQLAPSLFLGSEGLFLSVRFQVLSVCVPWFLSTDAAHCSSEEYWVKSKWTCVPLWFVWTVKGDCEVIWLCFIPPNPKLRRWFVLLQWLPLHLFMVNDKLCSLYTHSGDICQLREPICVPFIGLDQGSPTRCLQAPPTPTTRTTWAGPRPVLKIAQSCELHSQFSSGKMTISWK